MKTLTITSVVDFELKDRVEDVLASELFDIVRNQGSRFGESKKIQNLENAVKYLNHQFDRLRKYALTGQFEKFDYLADTLLKSSKVFLIYALNHVLETHPGMHPTKVVALLEKVIEAARDEKSTLEYKRVWIDKKPGDYGRPLGVPEMVDRIYGHMYTRIMEAYLCGTDQYSKDQHGGTPGRGTLTFIQELAERLRTADRVFEFDIKGYFDHIKHESILEMFESKVIVEYLVGALKSKPTKYILPPEEKDEALNIYKQNDLFKIFEVQFREDNMIDISPRNHQYGKFNLTLSFPQETRPVIINRTLLRNLQPSMNFDDWRITYTPSNELGTRIKLVHLETNWETDIYTQEKVLDIQRVTLEKLYAMAQTQGHIRLENVNPFSVEREEATETSRAIGRDNWKNLNLEGQGVPQGSSFGPVLASVLLGKLMSPYNGLQYMDDGLIFLGKEDGLKEDWNEEIGKKLATIGCELAPEKTRTLRALDLMTQGVKIVGTRWTQVRQFFNYTVSSETRAGIKRKLFPDIKDNYLQILIGLYEKGHISPSKHKMLRWYLDEDNSLKQVRESDLFRVADKIGILGNILQKAYSPVVTLEEMKQQIDYGIFKANLKMMSSSGSLGERILSHSKAIIVETTEGRAEVKPTIFTVRAIANDVLLRYLKRELPVRSLKVQGLRKLRKTDGSCTKRGKSKPSSLK